MDDSKPGRLVGFIGDVHGNPVALTAVLDELARRNVGSLRGLGDWVGYSVGVGEVVETLMDKEITSVAGNHDLMIAGIEAGEPSDLARQSIDIGRGLLSRDHLQHLSSLPVRIDEEWPLGRVVMVHGTPDRPVAGYLRAEDVETVSLPPDADFVATGATHRPLQARRGSTRVMNPGSVGIPRDGDPRASFAVVDSSTGAVELIRVPYDPTTTAMRNKMAGIPEVVNEYLFLGRPAPEPVDTDTRGYAAFSSSIDQFGEGREVFRTGAGFLATVGEALIMAVVLRDSGRLLLRSSPIAGDRDDPPSAPGLRWMKTPDGWALEQLGSDPLNNLGERELIARYEGFETRLKTIFGGEAPR